MGMERMTNSWRPLGSGDGWWWGTRGWWPAAYSFSTFRLTSCKNICVTPDFFMFPRHPSGGVNRCHPPRRLRELTPRRSCYMYFSRMGCRVLRISVYQGCGFLHCDFDDCWRMVFFERNWVFVDQGCGFLQPFFLCNQSTWWWLFTAANCVKVFKRELRAVIQREEKLPVRNQSAMPYEL